MRLFSYKGASWCVDTTGETYFRHGTGSIGVSFWPIDGSIPHVDHIIGTISPVGIDRLTERQLNEALDAAIQKSAGA